LKKKNLQLHAMTSRTDFSLNQATNLNFEFNTIHGYMRESVFKYVYIYLCVI